LGLLIPAAMFGATLHTLRADPAEEEEASNIDYRSRDY
jgi:hypothetical protein